MPSTFTNDIVKPETCSTKYLKRYAKMLDELINGPNPCFGTRDVFLLEVIERELESRGQPVRRAIV